MTTRRLLAALAAAVSGGAALGPTPAWAQQVAGSPRVTLRLDSLQDAALERDPRGAQRVLLGAQSELRQRTLDAERLPSLGINAQAQYQSSVLSLPFVLPNGSTPPSPPQDSYDAYLIARERIYDPTLAARHTLEPATLAEARARRRASLFALRAKVNDGWFSAGLAEDQRAAVETGITDLAAQLEVARRRVRAGSALPSEAAMLEAELLRRRQSAAELAASRDAALTVLSELTGRTITAADTLAMYDLAAPVAQAREALDSVRARPEYEQFARSRALLRVRQETSDAQSRPRVSAFGRAGYGRPGLNPFARDFNSYWLAGVQLEWSPWSWGTTGRDREVLALQERIVSSDEAAFTESLKRSVARDLAALDRLEPAIAQDETIISLREQVLRETRLRFAEGVITSAELVDRETDLLAARIALATHRTELAQARARFLTTLGLPVR
jgi:outer membrane protein TolC